MAKRTRASTRSRPTLPLSPPGDTILRLRRKLETDPSRPSLLHTIPGVGVLLKADEPSADGGQPAADS